MTGQRDIEPILDAWMAPGPSQMPDRLYHDLLDRIERTPQRRVAWAPRRFTNMFSPLKLPVAAAVAALIIGVVAWPMAQAPNEPATTPSPSTATSAEVPSELTSTWVAAPRVVEGLSLSDTVAGWRISAQEDQTYFELDRQGSGRSTLLSEVQVTAPGQMELTSLTDRSGCPRGARGTYAWSLAEDGTEVTIETVDDECPQRAAYLAGTWMHVGCELGTYACVGALEPGRHPSAVLDPRGGPRDPAVARPGGLTYEVPAGWANVDDWLSHLTLMPVEVYEGMIREYDHDRRKDQVSVWARPVAIAAEEPSCVVREDPAGGDSAASLAAWLSGHPALRASEPTTISIGGHVGYLVDIDLEPAEAEACSGAFGGAPIVPLFGNGAAVDQDGILREDPILDYWSIAAEGRCPGCADDPMRLILLDVGGDPVVILVDTRDPADFESFVEQAMPIVGSFEFPA